MYSVSKNSIKKGSTMLKFMNKMVKRDMRKIHNWYFSLPSYKLYTTFGILVVSCVGMITGLYFIDQRIMADVDRYVPQLP